MDTDQLSRMGIDTFIMSITYLPFTDVVSVCSANTTLHAYCSDPRYNTVWKRLIDNTFQNIYDYEDIDGWMCEKCN